MPSSVSGSKPVSSATSSMSVAVAVDALGAGDGAAGALGVQDVREPGGGARG